jgi:hypothetical protein
VTDVAAGITVNSGPGNDTFTLSIRLVPGAGSDGIELGAELSFGALLYSLPVAGFHPGAGAGQLTSAAGAGQPPLTGTLTKLTDGSVTLSVTGSGLERTPSSPTPVWIKIGNDLGSSRTTL